MKPSRLAPKLLLFCLPVFLFCGCSEEQNQLASDNKSPLVIEPNLSVGPIRADMTVQQVITQLGEPQRRTENSLEYARLGLAVMPDSDGVVQVVMCGDVTGINGPFAKAFTGRTKEGIGMNSTRADVIKAYGEPTASKKMGWGLESLQYQALGLTLTLEGGKVHHMIVRLRGPDVPDQTVTVDLK
jgi:hypothetical protein